MSEEIQQVLEKLMLNKETGEFFWIKPSKHHPDLLGKIAGGARANKSNKKYWVIKLNGKAYKRGRLVYLVIHGKWPEPCVDHINGDSTDDRPSNLREATIMENAWNHKKRARRIQLPIGVRNIASGKFQARIGYCGKQIHLGAFQSPNEASAAYQSKRKELYGQFA